MNVRVRLTRSLTTSEGLDHLARIVQAVGDGWHEWLAPDPDEAPELSRYFEHYRPHSELLQKSYARARAYPGSNRTIVVAEDSELPAGLTIQLGRETTLSAEVAAILLTQPVDVLVENKLNDGAFFSRLLTILDPDLVQLFHESRPRVRFYNGGGNTVAASLVRDRANEAARTGVPLHLLVIADSDSRYPGHGDAAVVALRRACQAAGAEVHILEKRAIENYVPDRVLSDYAADNSDVAASVSFILSLTPQVRDHYPIKTGIPSANGSADLPEGPEKRLYDGIVFPKGPRPKLPHAAGRFLSSTVADTRQDLIDRQCLTEVEHMIDWIRGEL